MSTRGPSRKDIEALASSMGPEVGIDPRYLKKITGGSQFSRKVFQLCRQVQETLSTVLAGCSDDVLRDLEVASVSPAVGVGRLLVSVRPSPSAGPSDAGVIEAHLAGAAGLLRQEVARAVHRRKVPELIFQVLRMHSGLIRRTGYNLWML